MDDPRTFTRLEGKVIARVEMIEEEFEQEDSTMVSNKTICVFHFTDGGQFKLIADGFSSTNGYRWLALDWKPGRKKPTKTAAKKTAAKKRKR